MRKTTLLAVAGATAMVTGFAAQTGTARAAEQCGDISIAQMNWAAAEVTTNIAKFMLDQGYGCNTSLVKSDTIPAITSIAENGRPDVVTNLWLNSAGDAYKKLESEGKIKRVAKTLQPGGVEGWWIPTYLAKEHPELKTIEGVMAHPEWVGGTFNNCPDGWGCRVVSDNLIKALDLESSGIKVFNHGSGQTLASSIGSAFADKKPWFGYYWGPTVVMGNYDMTRVKLGDYDKAKFDNLQNKDASNPQVSDFPAAPVLTSVTSDFAKTHPAETEFFSKMSFKTDTMSKLLAWQDENKASGEETAVYFIKNYQDTWKNWLDADAQKKLSKLIGG
ncbi:glycine betaine/proline transport system substrate-binding protein [Thioclava sp. ES.031]|uniref:ABC transporter substrate-binding protein n=1 Tax=Thioclava sp. ES.031 TaxID=1798203 RepID=UPI000BF81E7E|nr:ABC transporter substrate-binding protein [Thioclava sp. ES.031]PFG63207.1 glycine betaine/proline transport system substrate-binding protein [Thioclava sp. ES.031]